MRSKSLNLSCIILACFLALSLLAGVASAEDEEPIEPLQTEFTHTVFVEEFTTTTCPHCPSVGEALNNLYISGDYEFFFIAMITNKVDAASQRGNEYNIEFVPTTMLDGGYISEVGSTDNVEQEEQRYSEDIEECGAREVEHEIQIDIAGYDIGAPVIQGNISVTNLQTEGYEGRLMVSIVEIVSRYPNNDGNPYHFGLLDFLIDEDLSIPGSETYETSAIWDGSEHQDRDGNSFEDINPDNIMLIVAVYNSQPHPQVQPSSPPIPFTAYYVDQSAATTLNPPPVYGVEITPTTQSHTVSPGQSTIYNLNVKNTGNIEDGISLTKSGDQSDWATLSDTWISLEPNSSQDITLEVNVPSDALEGDYDIFVTATSDGDSSATATATTTSIVSTVVTYGVNLFSDQTSLTTHPGESVIYTITVENTGNTEDTIDISKSGANSHWGTLSHNSVNIQPGSSQDITLTVDVPSDAQTGDHTILVKGTSQGDPSESSEISTITKVESYIYGVNLEPEYQEESLEQGDSHGFTISVSNTGNTQETIKLEVEGDYESWADFSQSTLNLDSSASQNVIFTVNVPSSATTGNYLFTVKGVYQGDTSVFDEVDVKVTVIEPGTIIITGVTHSPSEPTTNDEITVTAEVTGDNIDSVFADYYKGTTLFTDPMQYIGNDQYSGIFGPLDAGDYQYEVRVEDNDGNTYTSQKFSFTVSEAQITISDVIHSPSDPTKDDEITVTATVIGDNIQSVYLDYCEGGTCYPSIQMQPSGSNHYSVTFGPLEVGDYEYEIRAEDDIGNSYKSSKFSLTVENASTPKNGDGTTDGKGEAPWYDSENARYIILLLIIVIIVCALLAGAFARRPKKAATEEVESQIIQLIPEEPMPEAQTVATPMAAPAAAPMAAEPVFSPITLPENEDISCPKCYTVFSIPFEPRPMPVQCPSCGQKGIID